MMKQTVQTICRYRFQIVPCKTEGSSHHCRLKTADWNIASTTGCARIRMTISKASHSPTPGGSGRFSSEKRRSPDGTDSDVFAISVFSVVKSAREMTMVT